MPRKLFKGLIVGLLVLFFNASGFGADSGQYKPTKRSLNTHEVPDWFHDAKFGIFIHWTIASVPAFAPVSDREIWEIAAEEGIEGQLRLNPYVEWYLNTMQIEGSPTQQYHNETYGEDFSYFDFATCQLN